MPAKPKAKSAAKASKAAAKPAAKPAAKSASKPSGKSRDHIFLVDGSSYIFRAYFAMFKAAQNSKSGYGFKRSDGLPTGAIMFFCNMLWKLFREGLEGVKPTHLGVIFDHSGETFRNEIYDKYKANRDEPPSDLIPQFPLMRDAVRAFGLVPIEEKGFEADDLIATYAREALAEGADVTIVAGDKDLMQLIRPGITMYDPMPGRERRIGPKEVEEKFGVGPDKVVEVQSLAGDSTDNVPGVPGIGIKTAAQLIQEYGDLETLLSRASEIKQEKRRQSLIEFADQARVSKKLVQLDDKAPVHIPLDDLRMADPNGKQIIAFLKAMEFTSLTKRVAEATDTNIELVEADPELRPGDDVIGKLKAEGQAEVSGEEVKPAKKGASAPAKAKGEKGALTPINLAEVRAKLARGKVDRSKYEMVSDLKRLAEWTAKATDQGYVAFDTETTSLDPLNCELCGVSLALSPNEACYIPLSHKTTGDLLSGGGLVDGQIEIGKALKTLKPMLEDPSVLKIAHNFKYDYLVMLAQHGIDVAPFDDTMLMSYALDAGRERHGMDELSERHLGHTPIAYTDVAGKGKTSVCFDQVDLAKATEYAAEDADVTLRLWQYYKGRMTAEGMHTVYETLERPLVTVLARMEQSGITIDPVLLARLSNEFATNAVKLEQNIAKVAGEGFNPGSAKQLGDILFGKMKLPGGTKTATGAWSTRANVLEDLAEEGHELPKLILSWRSLTKLKSTYTDALPAYMDKENRVHTSYALAATPTGRLASSDPNVQNIPIRTEEGRKIRRAFIAPKGMKLVSADYSQIELRLLAEIANIPQLRKAFHDGLDIHAMTASEMFGVPVKGMPAEVRRRAKAINFGIIYGISAFGLANQLSIPREEAGAYIKKYFERFPGIREYMDETKAFCKQHGYVTTLFGRKCHYPAINDSNPSMRGFMERAAINARLQGTAADIIRRAMIRMEGALKAAKLNARMLLQVHDELVFEVPDKEVEKTLDLVAKTMMEAPFPAVSLSVPLHVDARAADNWEEAH
ncbi:MAG TPA: DNA polymerase I [Xanthobacteraceae bacterium]|nr:DNA polymerase I [Xanthobacteraceae bacterium]